MQTLKYRIIYWLAKKLLPLVDEKDIISFDKQKNIFIADKKLTDIEVNNLRQEVLFFRKTRLWKLINIYFNELAKRKIFEDAKDMPDIIFGKTILYVLSVQNTILDNIKKD